VLHRLESLFAGDGDGIADGLMDVWNTFEDLANSPDDIGMRTSVIGALDNLVTRINTAASGIDLVVSHTSFDLQTRVEETNRLLSELADLNSRVFDAEVTETAANDLLDRRDLVVDQLAALTGIRATEDERGMMRVSTGAVALVDGVNVVPLDLAADGVTITSPGGLELNPGGALGGLRSALTVDIPDHRAELDAFVADLADALNAAHAAGFTPSGAAGGPLLSYDGAAPARTLAAVVVDADDLAAAGAATAAPHDGDNAAAIGALRFSEVGAGGTLTLDDQFREFLTRLGSETSSALAAADSQESLSASVDLQRLNQQGVSVDEEMMMLMNYQRSYEAAARVMNIIDETLELLVNRLGVGGR